MFTGLIEATGTVRSLEHVPGGATRLTLDAPALSGRWKQGDSIAVNGVCLTALPVPAAGAGSSSQFAADLAEETLRRTTLPNLRAGATVNLELPTPAGSPLGGHVVQGHVDGVGRVFSLEALAPDAERTDWRLTLDAPPQLAPNIVSQGSLTVDGISLTVAKLHPAATDGSVRVEIAIIPHTYRATNLHTLAPGAAVNLETDVLARYAAQQSRVRETGAITVEALLANGY